MSEHRAKIAWRLIGDGFEKGRFSRAHRWTFDGGVEVPASPAPTSVPAPYSDPDAVDPEEAYVASISSCHMLTFLYLASKAGFVVEAYDDGAVGYMENNAEGMLWVARVLLNPVIRFQAGREPDASVFDGLHHAAHSQCFIANSVRTEIVVSATAVKRQA